MKNDLKPCPFCGKAALLEEYDGKHGYDEYFNLGCSDEKCAGNDLFSAWDLKHKEECIGKWNARTARPEVDPNEPCKHHVERRGYSRGYDMCWCNGCGKLLWCSDGVIPAGKEKNDDYGTWCAQRVVAWGCQSETDGGARCSRACGNCVMRVNAALSPLGRPE